MSVARKKTAVLQKAAPSRKADTAVANRPRGGRTAAGGAGMRKDNAMGHGKGAAAQGASASVRAFGAGEKGSGRSVSSKSSPKGKAVGATRSAVALSDNSDKTRASSASGRGGAKSVVPRRATAKRAQAGASSSKARTTSGSRAEAKKTARAASHRTSQKPSSGATQRGVDAALDLFLETPSRRGGRSGGPTKKRRGALFSALNACLLIGIAILAALGVRQQGQYAEFVRMRDVVDQQTFYEGTTVEGVDVSTMTLSQALDYWRDRVEPRY